MNDKINFLQSFKGKTVDEVIEILEKAKEQSNKEKAFIEIKNDTKKRKLL